MWLVWMFFAISSVATGYYCARGSALNTWVTPAPAFATGMLFIPALICVGLRYWLTRLRRPWLVFLIFLFGVVLSYLVGQFGIFIFRGWCILFQVLSGILLFGYWPLFVRVGGAPPPVPRAGLTGAEK